MSALIKEKLFWVCEGADVSPCARSREHEAECHVCHTLSNTLKHIKAHTCTPQPKISRDTVVFRGRLLQFPTRKRVSKVHMMTSVFKPCGSSPSPLNTKRRVLCDVCVRLGPSRGLRLCQHSVGGLYFSLSLGLGHLFDFWLGFSSFNKGGRRGITTCEAHPVPTGVAFLGFFRRFLRLSTLFQ